MSGPKVPNDALLNAGLELMRQNGKELTKVDSFGRSMMYKTPDGATVRVRTCNDHILIVLADKVSKNARLNIEGTDNLLIVMPEVERTPGKVKAYLVPTKVAADASRSSHQKWLDKGPNTKGDNRTWNLWFRDDGPKDRNFSTKWAEYQLKGEASTESINATAHVTGVSAAFGINPPTAFDGGIKAIVESARQMISKAAGVPPDAVRITIQFGV